MAYDQNDAFFLLKSRGGVAVPGLLTPTHGVSFEVPVIFDTEGTLAVVSGVPVASGSPQCVVQSKYFPNPENESDATIIIENINYKIDRAQPDADGTTVLILTRN